jgi:mannose-6-phosphate isomerase-like protein (cupin superfamily)
MFRLPVGRGTLTPEDTVNAEAIDRFWDQITEGHTDATPDLDPDHAATIRFLHAHDDRPQPNPTFRRHLRDELVHAHAIPDSRELNRLHLANGHAGQSTWGVLQPPPARRRWALAPLATAALLVLTLVGGFLVSGSGRSLRQGLAPLLLPAISGTPTPEGSEPIKETILDTTVADIPDGANSVFVELWTFKPGADALVMPPFAAPRAIVADDGSFLVTLAGAERSLQPGESLDVPAGQELIVRSTEQSEATLLHVGTMASYPQPDFDSAFITYRYMISTSGKMPEGATRFVVERFTIAPASSLPPFTLAENQWVGVREGTVGVALKGDRLPLYWKSGEEREFARNYFPAIAPGTDVTLRNAGDDPLVLYRLTITSGAGEATPGTPLAAISQAYKNPLS